VRGSTVDPRTAPPDAVGRALRDAVDAEYTRLAVMRELKMPGTVITTTVERYIPVGSTFERAEPILKAAGLQMDPSRTHSLDPDSYALWARIDPYPEGWELFRVCRQSLSIELSPMAEMRTSLKATIDPASVDWSMIRRVEARISAICL
jgi:hypothetical protein